MKALSLLLVLMLSAACGQRTKKVTKYVENPFDNSGNDARLTDLENRVASLESARLAMIADINTAQAQITALENGQTSLSADLSALQTSVSDLSALTATQVSSLSSRLDAVEAAIVALDADLDSSTANASAALDNLSDYVDYLVSLGVVESNYLRSQITALQGSVAAASALQSSNHSAQAALIATLQSQMSSAQSSVNSLSSQIVSLQNNENITSLIDPCGDGAGFDEVLLKLSSGKIVASFSQNANGLNTRFSVITPGTYVTTDGTNCTFTVNSNGSVTW